MKAGDDDDMLNNDGMPDVFIEEEEELEGATAYPAINMEKPTCRPAPGSPRPNLNFKLPSRGRDVRRFTHGGRSNDTLNFSGGGKYDDNGDDGSTKNNGANDGDAGDGGC